MSIKVKVKKLHPDAVIPHYAHEGDAGFDLVAVEDVVITPGETKAIPLGLAFEIPEGYEMQIRPRSGLSLKTKLRQSNCVGTIDSGYRGEVKVMFDNINHLRYEIDDRYEYNYEEELEYWGSGLVIEEDVALDLQGKPYLPIFGVPLGTYIIRKGDRVCQGVIQRLPTVELIEVDELSDSERGEDGFGSTGVKKTEIGCPFDEPIYNPDIPKE
jgi:dUTP pyrophosphatase